jgi:hypothetical protein
VAAGTVTDVALLIAGLGMSSLLLNEPVIATPGLGQAPGVLAVAASVVAFAAVLWGALGSAWVLGTLLVSALAAFLAYVVTLAVAVATVGADVGASLGVASRAATSWPGAVIAVAAALASLLAFAVAHGVGTSARWPWERDDED